MPWVRLHGIKDYYGMAWLAQQHPEVHLTFNLVPSLLDQLEDYAAGTAEDAALELTRRPAADLADAETQAILDEFFRANWETMVRPHARYAELLLKRRFGRRTAAQAACDFAAEDLRDLQVWATLAWFFPQLLRDDPVLRELVQKGRGFSEDDKAAMLAKQREVLAAIVPMYRDLQERGTAELTVSPYYHPILPLLCRMDRAREAMPTVPLPRGVMDFGDDARTQVERAVEAYRRVFGRAPRGMWPSEGSVSPEVPPVLAAAGIRWMATDEGILCRSLGCTLHRDPHGLLGEREVLYRPYLAPLRDAGCGMRNEQEIGNSKPEIRHPEALAIIFRDHYLSDLIGFHYYHRPAEEAAADFAQRLAAIGAASGHHDAFVSVILDGENAWEYYSESGMPFLHALYRRLASVPGVSTVTVSEYLEAHPPTATLPRLFSGSWINSDFAVWVGHEEDRRAWELLAQTRQFLVARAGESPAAEGLPLAWEELFVAEGSDWFWWYGDDRSSAQDVEFDRLFRGHLKNVYRLLGERAPDALDEPVSQPRLLPYTRPTAFVRPAVNGRRGGFFDWSGAGVYQAGRDGGSMERATPGQIQAVYFGFTERELHLRVDFSGRALAELPPSTRVVVCFSEPRAVCLTAGDLAATTPSLRVDGRASRGGRVAALEVVEVACPFEELGFRAREAARFHVRLLDGETLLERVPRAGNLAFEIPSPDFEREMWQV